MDKIAIAKAEREPNTFLCRVNDNGPHTLHVHDQPSYYADIQRHEEMGWVMARECQIPGMPFLDGDPGVKAVRVVDLTAVVQSR